MPAPWLKELWLTEDERQKRERKRDEKEVPKAVSDGEPGIEEEGESRRRLRKRRGPEEDVTAHFPAGIDLFPSPPSRPVLPPYSPDVHTQFALSTSFFFPHTPSLLAPGTWSRSNAFHSIPASLASAGGTRCLEPWRIHATGHQPIPGRSRSPFPSKLSPCRLLCLAPSNQDGPLSFPQGLTLLAPRPCQRAEAQLISLLILTPSPDARRCRLLS